MTRSTPSFRSLSDTQRRRLNRRSADAVAKDVLELHPHRDVRIAKPLNLPATKSANTRFRRRKAYYKLRILNEIESSSVGKLSGQKKAPLLVQGAKEVIAACVASLVLSIIQSFERGGHISSNVVNFLR